MQTSGDLQLWVWALLVFRRGYVTYTTKARRRRKEKKNREPWDLQEPTLAMTSPG